MKKVSLILVCLLSVGCTDENVKIVQKTKWGSESDKTLGSILNNRPICKKTEWVSDVTESAVKVTYTCELTNYSNQLLRIMNQDMIKIEKNDADMLRKYKEDMEISDFRLDQLYRLEKALIELSENGIAELYKNATETLHMNNIDYSYVFKGPIEPIVPVDGYDDTAQRNLYTALKIIQETFLRHGLVKESFAHIGLNRAKMKNVDYLKITDEDKLRWFAYDRNTITQRKMSAFNALKELETGLSKKIDFFNTLGNTTMITTLNQKIVFQVVDNLAVPIQCEFNAVTYKGVTLTVDEYKSCLNMATAREYETDFLKLFTQFYRQIIEDEKTNTPQP